MSNWPKRSLRSLRSDLKRIAGRNDACPCGSGKKYKHCHLGKELHSLNDRAAWLYLKMMRFMQLTNRYLPDAVVAEMTSSLETPDLADHA